MPANQRRWWGAIAILFLTAHAAPSCAERYSGTVTQVFDGDTLIVRSREQHISVQLEGVDAPDSGEPYAKGSAESLAQLCVQKTAVVVSAGTDEYGRVLGTVVCNGINVNEAQLQRGWGILRATSRTPASWRALQRDAEQAHRGLWSGH